MKLEMIDGDQSARRRSKILFNLVNKLRDPRAECFSSRSEAGNGFFSRRLNVVEDKSFRGNEFGGDCRYALGERPGDAHNAVCIAVE